MSQLSGTTPHSKRSPPSRISSRSQRATAQNRTSGKNLGPKKSPRLNVKSRSITQRSAYLNSTKTFTSICQTQQTSPYTTPSSRASKRTSDDDQTVRLQRDARRELTGTARGEGNIGERQYRDPTDY